MLFLSEADVAALLPMPKAIDLMREAFRGLADRTSQNQPRRRLILPAGSILHQLAGAHGKYFGAKLYSTHALHGAHFVVVLYDAETARPLAILEANHLGQIRTGAASGLATDLLARKDVRALGVIGSGFQAETQVEAVLAVRPIELGRFNAVDQRQLLQAMASLVAMAVERARLTEQARRPSDRKTGRPEDREETATGNRQP